jgi:hypothetical protein
MTNIKAKEVDYYYNTEGLGYTATIYELSEGKRYSVVCKKPHEYQPREVHVRTLRTDSLEHAIEDAKHWVGY